MARPLALKTYAFALVPVLGLAELGAHEVQVHSIVPAEDWEAARAAVAAAYQPGDLVVFEPSWADSIGRWRFGATLAGLSNETRPDDTRFLRAFEVSIRGFHDPELADWKKIGSQKTGAITITTLANPSPAHVIDALVDHASPTGMAVSRVDNGVESECRWVHSAPAANGLGSGPATPGERFACNAGGFVGLSLMDDLDDRPRRCFYAPTLGGATVVRVRFTNVSFGDALHGQIAVANFNERDRTGPNVTLTWRANDRVLGKITHVDGDGWKGFELSTSDLMGQHADLFAEIASSGGGRQFCFEADTR